MDQPVGESTPRRKEAIKMSLEKRVWSYGLNSTGSEYVQCRALVNTVINLGGSRNGGGFLHQLRTCQLLKKGSTPWNT